MTRAAGQHATPPKLSLLMVFTIVIILRAVRFSEVSSANGPNCPLSGV
jgi:hypothetical protein